MGGWPTPLTVRRGLAAKPADTTGCGSSTTAVAAAAVTAAEAPDHECGGSRLHAMGCRHRPQATLTAAAAARCGQDEIALSSRRTSSSASAPASAPDSAPASAPSSSANVGSSRF